MMCVLREERKMGGTDMVSEDMNECTQKNIPYTNYQPL